MNLLSQKHNVGVIRKNPYFEQKFQWKVQKLKWRNMLLDRYTKEHVSSITVHLRKSQPRVSILKDLIRGYFSRGYTWLCFVIMLRKIIQNGFHSNNESFRANLFLTLTQKKVVHLFNRYNSNFWDFVEYRKTPLEGKVNVFGCEVKVWISILLISWGQEGFMLVFRLKADFHSVEVSERTEL